MIKCGSIITCLQGHEIATFKRDASPGRPLLITEDLDWKIAQPEPGRWCSTLCPTCGSPWAKSGASGIRFHFSTDLLPPILEVLYCCAECQTVDASVPVPARITEDVVEWVEMVREIVQFAHHRDHSTCEATAVDLKIPVTGAEKIGGVTVH